MDSSGDGVGERARPRFGLAIGAAAVSVALVAGAVLTDEAPVAADRTEALTPAPSAVLEGRRVPTFLAAPLGDDRLRLGLEPVIAGSPEQTCLVVAAAGRTVLAHNPDLVLVPASNQKLLTAHAALAELGADHTWRTTVATEVPAAGGVVEGDLWLVGGGDPVLSTADFLAGFEGAPPAATSLEALADAVVAAGVTEITGGVMGDDGRYDEVREVEGWPSRQLGDSRPGPLGALLVNRGFDRYPTSPEDETSVSTASDPSREAAATFDDLLEERGITIRGSAGDGDVPEGATEVAAVTSPPLQAVTDTILGRSDNTIAEMLVKELGFARTGEGMTAGGLAVVEEQVRAAVGEAPGLVIADGSGLHDANRVSCATLVDLLDLGGPTSPLGGGLAVAARSGTLRTRYVDTLVAGRLSAKTGYVSESTSLSGYVQSLTGVPLTFSYVANADGITDEVVALQDALGAVLVQYPEGINLEEIAPQGAPPPSLPGFESDPATTTAPPSTGAAPTTTSG